MTVGKLRLFATGPEMAEDMRRDFPGVEVIEAGDLSIFGISWMETSGYNAAQRERNRIWRARVNAVKIAAPR